MPTPLRQALALLTLASLTLLPPLTMAQTTAPLPPAEPMAQEVGALWDPATITPLKLLNIDLFSRSELGQPVVVQPVIPYPTVGGGSFAYCLQTLDGLQSRLVEGIVCTDGFTLVRSLEMTFDEALALQAQFDISSGPAPVRRPTEFSWATFWTDTVVDPIHDLTETELSRRADWYDAVYPAAQDHELKLRLPAPADEEATDPTVAADPTSQRPVLADIVGVAGVAMTTGAGTDDAQANARFTLDGLDPATEFSTAYYCNAVASDEDNSDNPTDGATDPIDPHDLSKENVQKVWHLLHTEELDKRLWIAFLEANAEIRVSKDWAFSRFKWDLAGESYQDRSVTLYGCDDVFEAADRLHEAICDQWSQTLEMRTSMFGSAESDIEGYKELVAARRALGAKHAKELETCLKVFFSLNPGADVLFTLDDLANKDASIWDVPTVFVAGVPYISGPVYKFGTKILRTWKKAPRYGANFFDDLATSATRNADSTKLVLGKWSTTGQSYQKVAAHYKATYFKLDNWRELSGKLSRAELWKINEAFLDQQIKAGKQIILSQNPAKATGFFADEVAYLKQFGYTFVKDGWVWKAVKP